MIDIIAKEINNTNSSTNNNSSLNNGRDKKKKKRERKNSVSTKLHDICNSGSSINTSVGAASSTEFLEQQSYDSIQINSNNSNSNSSSSSGSGSSNNRKCFKTSNISNHSECLKCKNTNNNNSSSIKINNCINNNSNNINKIKNNCSNNTSSSSNCSKIKMEIDSYEDDDISYMEIDNWYSGDPLVSEVLRDEKETLSLIEKKRLELASVEKTISTLQEAKDSILRDIEIKKQFLKTVQKKKEAQIKTITNSYHSIATKYNLSQVECRTLTLILPEEVMLHIFKFLSPLDLCRGVCRVSTKWRVLAFDMGLWRDLCLQRRLLDGSNYYIPPSPRSSSAVATGSLSLSSLSSSTSLSTSLSSSSSSISTNGSGIESLNNSSENINNSGIVNNKLSWNSNWYVGEYRKDTNWRRGKYSTTILRGHKEIVWSLLFESDSNTLISGSEDMTVKVWDCNGVGNSAQYMDDPEDSKKRCTKTLTGHKNGTICLGSTETRLVSGSADGSLKIWDRQDGICLETIQTHSSVWCLQIMDNSLICGCVDGTMRVFDLNTSACLRTMRGHTAPVRCLQAINHNGQDLIVSGSYDKTIKIWDTNAHCINTIRAHTHKINCLQYENGQLVSGSHDSFLKIWDMNGGLIRTLKGHDNMIHCLQFKGNKLLSGSTDSTIKLWDMKTGANLNTIKGQSAVCCLKFNDSKLITGYEDSTIKIFDFSY